MTRKPVQISAGNSLCALCDDGTIWELIQSGWHKIPDIPQDAPAPPSWDAPQEVIDAYLESRKGKPRFEPVSVKDENGNHIGFVDRERND